MGYCGAVVKELLERAKKPGSTPGDTVFCFSVPFLSLFSLIFLNAIFPFDLFFFILNADPARHAPGSIYILSLSPKSTGQAYDQKKKSAVKTCPSPETAEFFSVLVDIMTNKTQYTTVQLY